MQCSDQDFNPGNFIATNRTRTEPTTNSTRVSNPKNSNEGHGENKHEWLFTDPISVSSSSETRLLPTTSSEREKKRRKKIHVKNLQQTNCHFCVSYRSFFAANGPPRL